MTAQEALHLYRAKDIVEKAFGNLKERLNLRRLLVSSEQGLDGKFFVAFVGLVLVSRLHRLMKDAKLYDELTMDELLDRLDVIEVFRRPGPGRFWSRSAKWSRTCFGSARTRFAGAFCGKSSSFSTVASKSSARRCPGRSGRTRP